MRNLYGKISQIFFHRVIHTRALARAKPLPEVGSGVGLAGLGATLPACPVRLLRSPVKRSPLRSDAR